MVIPSSRQRPRALVRSVFGALRDALWGAPGVLSPARPPRSRAESSLRWLLRIVGVLLAGGLFSGSTALLYFSGVPGSVAPFLAAIQTLPLAVAWRAPLGAWRLMMLGLLISTLLGLGVGPVTSVLALIPVVYCVAARYERRIVVAVGGIGSALAALLVQSVANVPPAALPAFIGALIGVLMLGDAVRQRGEAQRELAISEGQRQQELARRAVLEERSRIARELHDIVAHHMSMIAIQAEAAPYKIPDLSEEGRRTFSAIREASRAALAEMRRLIGLLRAEAETAERIPQPGLDRLQELVDGAREAGVPAQLTILGEPRPTAAGVSLSAYRIVQEALSNATRHAPGAPVEVEVWYQRSYLRVRISNEPRPDAPAAVTEGAEDGSELGHGLIGMRERITMLGGELYTGSRPNGGFVIEAVLPLDGSAEISGDDEGGRDVP